MKRVFLILAALAAWTAAAATPNRTATEAYVTNKIAAAVAAIPAPDYSTNNTELVETIGVATADAYANATNYTAKGFLPLTGGRITQLNGYDMYIGNSGTIETPWGGIWWMGLANPCGICCESLLGNMRLVNEGHTIWLPAKGGTVALVADVSGATNNLATVATSGAYSDLSGKPSIPTTAADVGALSTNGGTLNGGITVWGDSTFYCNTLSFSDTFKIKFMNAVMTPYLEILGDDIYLPLQSGTLALTSDIPTSMAWGAITSKPTTLSGYGITDALKADFSTLTNNAAFTSAVAAVSPPVDLSGYCTTGEAAGIASNVVSQAYIRQKLGVYLYVGEDGGIYVHTEE
ncbi:MAG: hypothetical protein II840_10325 [Kiritimatiellae bacterium]|nr:hypothetical protein [Kiritimatiellia bacterium]